MIKRRRLWGLLGVSLLLASGLTAQASSAVAAGGRVGPTPPVAGAKDRPVKGGVYAPKGYPGSTGGVSTLATGGPWFQYGKGSQGGFGTPGTGVLPTGLQARLHLDNPYLDTAKDYHSLAEVEIEKTINTSGTGQRNIVEVGATKDPVVCAGKTNTYCLFVFWWKDGVKQCYNGCGFVDYVPTPPTVNIDAGDAVPTADIGTGKIFYITHFNSQWWVSYNGLWIGYYPDTLWSTSNTYGPAVAGFNELDFGQAFAEVAGGETSSGSGVEHKSCTDMMNGQDGSLGAVPAVQIASAAFDNLALASVNLSVSTVATGTLNPYYSVTKVTGRTFYVGGPGYNSAGTAKGNIGSC